MSDLAPAFDDEGPPAERGSKITKAGLMKIDWSLVVLMFLTMIGFAAKALPGTGIQTRSDSSQGLDSDFFASLLSHGLGMAVLMLGLNRARPATAQRASTFGVANPGPASPEKAAGGQP